MGDGLLFLLDSTAVIQLQVSNKAPLFPPLNLTNRLEQQAILLIEKLRSQRSSTLNSDVSAGEVCAEGRGQQVSIEHVEFLVNMSRASRRKDWAWFEISEAELQRM